MTFDRRILVSCVVAGSLWLVPLLVFGAWVLALIGLGYVVLASVFLAAAHRDPMTSRPREAAVWAMPWVVAIAVWVAVLSPIDGAGLLTLWVAIVVATPAYVVWLLSAALLRTLVGGA